VAAASAPPAPPPDRGWGLNKQIVILGIVLCAVALSLAYPLRNYLRQRADLVTAVATERALEQAVTELSVKQAALADPAYLAAEARRRLQYVRPGDTVYVVRAPDLVGTEPGADGAAAPSASAWYSQLWDTMTASGVAVDPTALQPTTTEAEPTHISPTIPSGPDGASSSGSVATTTTSAVPTSR
jgi:cell division protein FtsB